ncbi:MAG: low molecular weight protein-tyrosine-phosphatase [Crocinitomicaceae bacterium]|nr:low molecular weight phosphotyrosine protein phosphatase [Crocinitomicaceae bacterium]
MKILMVCLGNICRSPIAEGILRQKVKDQGLNIETDSAGTSSFHIGEAPDRRMRATAKQNGVDIDDLRARQFVPADFDRFDIIYAMDQSNYNNILSLAESEVEISKVKMILNEIQPGANQAVPDPYYGGDEGFQHVFDLLDEATDVIIEKYG